MYLFGRWCALSVFISFVQVDNMSSLCKYDIMLECANQPVSARLLCSGNMFINLL